MPFRALGDLQVSDTTLTVSVCLVGAGVAGLIAATRLARLGGSVVLLESGTRGRDEMLQLLNRIDGPAVNDGGPRHRGVGGNSVLWAGKLLPLAAQDTGPRPYLDMPGWPLTRQDIDRYRNDIETMMGLDHASFEEDASDLLDPSALLPRHNADFVLRWPKIPTTKNHDLAHVLRKEIDTLDNLVIWTDATSAVFEVDRANGRLIEINALSANGRSLKVRADEYLITAGTLESTRMLLLLDRCINDVMGGDGGVLGRYFNDHLGVKVAALQPLDASATNRALADRFLLASTRHLHFELTPALQRQAAIGSGYFDIGVELAESSSFLAAKRLLQSVRGRRPDLSLADARAIVADMPAFLQSVHWRYRRKQKFWQSAADMQIKFWIEQLPRWTNRLHLSEKCDALGLPMLKIDWASSEAEEKTIGALTEATREYWARHLSPWCALSWRSEFLETLTPKVHLAGGHAHPAGSTRMGTNDKTSVVDPDLKVHAMPNVSVASASVFPTSGSANPTYTIMQMAMRAADAIAKRLARQ